MDLGYIVKLKQETDEEDKTIFIHVNCAIANLKLNLEISQSIDFHLCGLEVNT